MSFVCATCGKEHDEIPEPAYQRPDVVWRLDESERRQRVTGGDDFCVLRGDGAADADRFFIRGIIRLSVKEPEADWSIGAWAEVDGRDFARYRELYDVDGSGEPRFKGAIANAVRSFEDSLGAQVLVQLGTATRRPSFWFPWGARSSLARWQASGITLERIHEVIGAFA